MTRESSCDCTLVWSTVDLVGVYSTVRGKACRSTAGVDWTRVNGDIVNKTGIC